MKFMRKIGVLMMAFSVAVCGGQTSLAKTATYNNKTVTYTYEMGMVPYGSVNYLEVCTAKMTYPVSISMKIDGTITAKKNGRTYTMSDYTSKNTDWLTKNFAFDTPGYDITHFLGKYTIDKQKTYKIDTVIN